MPVPSPRQSGKPVRLPRNNKGEPRQEAPEGSRQDVGSNPSWSLAWAGSTSTALINCTSLSGEQVSAICA